MAFKIKSHSQAMCVQQSEMLRVRNEKRHDDVSLAMLLFLSGTPFESFSNFPNGILRKLEVGTWPQGVAL